MQILITNLHILLASTYALQLKFQNYHWNVVGQNFYSLHLFFETEYNTLFNMIDKIAEKIRTFDVKVTADFKLFQELSIVQQITDNISDKDMILDLYEDNVKICNLLKIIIQLATELNLYSLIDFAVQQLSYHETTAWKLRASQYH
jgi:starvation-inducible DNA-binding protein